MPALQHDDVLQDQGDAVAEELNTLGGIAGDGDPHGEAVVDHRGGELGQAIPALDDFAAFRPMNRENDVRVALGGIVDAGADYGGFGRPVSLLVFELDEGVD